MREEITKKELIKILKFFILEIEKAELDFSTIDNIDFYWDIVNKKILYNPAESVESEFSLWQISSDWEDLLKLKEDKRDIIGYDFKKLSSIVRLLDLVYTETEILNINNN